MEGRGVRVGVECVVGNVEPFVVGIWLWYWGCGPTALWWSALQRGWWENAELWGVVACVWVVMVMCGLCWDRRL